TARTAPGGSCSRAATTSASPPHSNTTHHTHPWVVLRSVRQRTVDRTTGPVGSTTQHEVAHYRDRRRCRCHGTGAGGLHRLRAGGGQHRPDRLADDRDHLQQPGTDGGGGGRLPRGDRPGHQRHHRRHLPVPVHAAHPALQRHRTRCVHRVGRRREPRRHR